ncbi:MAG: hypothetical protein PWP30_2099 [Eubacteriaceae bacterium]|nr:hypothetical protein [Eubacteriaceae bacterium]MDK2937413.1 hypothetical protein [Eubacteriaceae bacterium]
MVEIFELVNEKSERKNEIARAMSDLELYPAIVEEETEITKYTKLPLSKMATLGVAFEPLSAALQTVVSGGQATSGLYRVTVPPGGQLAQFKDGSGYLGSVLTQNGAVGGGQAVLNPIAFNPTMLFMAAALASIDKKLDSILEIQQEMLAFLVQKERSELKGDLAFLMDTINNYKHSWNNEKFKNNNHIKVLDIKQESGRKIDFYREQIKTKIKKKSFFHSDQGVKKQLNKIQTEFKDYHLALYLYAFSSFLEVMLLENYESAYLDNIAKKIEDALFEYRELFADCYEQIEGNAKSSVQSHLFKGLASANKVAGETLAKIPGISKSQIDETLIENSEKLGTFGVKRTENTMQQLIERDSTCVIPFVENINTINRLYNQPMELLFDNENVYIGAAV